MLAQILTATRNDLRMKGFTVRTRAHAVSLILCSALAMRSAEQSQRGFFRCGIASRCVRAV